MACKGGHSKCYLVYGLHSNVKLCRIDPSHDPVTWYKIIHAGEQVAQWDFLTSMCDLVLCDRIVQRTYYTGCLGIMPQTILLC